MHMTPLKAMMLASFFVPLAVGISNRAAAQELDLCGLQPTFFEDFKELKVSAWTMGDNRWIAHTPWAGDFGDAAFTDPGQDFPFTVNDSGLRIEARKDASGKWRGGLLASADPTGAGFTQMYGYFEAKMKMPVGPGTWPAFWLMESWPKGTPPGIAVEVDPIEFYGRAPNEYHAGYIVWDHIKNTHDGGGHVVKVPDGALSADFHTFGIEVTPELMTYYYDRQRVWRVPTPKEHTHPFLVLVNLALGSGWPIDKTPNPSFLDVAYVHVYERRPETCEATPPQK
ncbi:1,3-1,4-beta-glycanase [Beijerinckiaceae bacterium]|nr:1,3-1,4-beta-glycanase [Beijerinckiaceae bacterium]